MSNLHEQFPQYGWKQNMGYPTASHREAIKKHGVTPLHRLSFTLLNEQLSLEL
jgi:ribonuclease HII